MCYVPNVASSLATAVAGKLLLWRVILLLRWWVVRWLLLRVRLLRPGLSGLALVIISRGVTRVWGRIERWALRRRFVGHGGFPPLGAHVTHDASGGFTFC